MRDKGVSMVRYADDFVLLCRTEAEARGGAGDGQGVDGRERPDPAPGQDPSRGLSVKGQGFEFLGYRFEAGRRFVRKKSLKAL